MLRFVRTDLRTVRTLLADDADLARIILPLLEAWRVLRIQAAELTRQLLAGGRRSEQCQLLMSIPGIGAIAATSYLTAVEDPSNFKRSRSVGAWLGLTTRRYQRFIVENELPHLSETEHF